MDLVGVKLLETYWQEEDINGSFCQRCDELITDRQFRVWIQVGEATEGRFEPTDTTLCECCYVLVTWPDHGIEMTPDPK